MIANEPHWAFRKGGILKRPGGMQHLDFSAYTRNKYAAWLKSKYGTIGRLNAVYGRQYSSFDEAKAAFTAPIDPEPLLGSPLWYDLCRFNMDRADAWFTFLKEQTLRNTSQDALISIKLLGKNLESGYRDDGIDLDYLTKLQGVMGADNQVVPLNTSRMKREYQDWRHRYMLDWREQSITLDFAKSLCPDKPFYDSEWHGLSGGGWACHELARGYVRTALWMAFSHGLNAINAWVWGRNEDGSFDPRSVPIAEILSNPTALDAFGRTLKELNAHGDTVHALVPRTRNYLVFYCVETAIQDPAYPGRMADVYESLKLLNVPVGFTTPTQIASISAASQTVIVPPTRFISDASLQALKSFGQSGKVVLVNGSEPDFSKNELGQPRDNVPDLKAFATVSFDAVLNMTAGLENVLASIKPAQPVSVEITDAGGTKAYGVMAFQTLDPNTGNPVVLLINLSQNSRSVTLKPAGKSSPECLNLLTGQSEPDTHIMAPYDILLLALKTDGVPVPKPS